MGTVKTFYYASPPILPSFLSGTQYIYATLYRPNSGFTICIIAGIVQIDGSILHGYGYYSSDGIIWTSK